MRTITQKVMKTCLYLITNAAFVFLITNVSTTCCGPGYQPSIPEEIKGMRRHGKKE